MTKAKQKISLLIFTCFFLNSASIMSAEFLTRKQKNFLILRANNGDKNAQDIIFKKVLDGTFSNVTSKTPIKLDNWNIIERLENKEFDNIFIALIYELRIHLEFKIDFTLETDENDPKGCFLLFVSYINLGENEKGMQWLKKSSSLGYPRAIYEMSRILSLGTCEQHNASSKAFEILKKASELNHLYAKYDLGLAYFQGTRVEKNIPLSLKILKESAKLGHELSITQVAIISLLNHEKGREHNKVIKWLRKAAQIDVSPSRGKIYFSLAKLLDAGDERIYWFSKAALYGTEQISADATIEITKSYQEDETPQAMYALARFTSSAEISTSLLSKSADLGFAKASRKMGELLLLTDEGKKNQEVIDQALNYYCLAANQNNSKALLELGNIHFLGSIVEKDIKKAFNFFYKSAKLGNFKALQKLEIGAKKNMLAQNLLGNLYCFGWSIEKNTPMAIDLFKKAAEQGHAYAMYKLGHLNLQLQNYHDAYTFTLQASVLGNIHASVLLGYLYQKGLGINQSDEMALKMFQIGAENGDIYSKRKVALLSDLK